MEVLGEERALFCWGSLHRHYTRNVCLHVHVRVRAHAHTHTIVYL